MEWKAGRARPDGEFHGCLRKSADLHALRTTKVGVTQENVESKHRLVRIVPTHMIDTDNSLRESGLLTYLSHEKLGLHLCHENTE